jgi:hypothetical protein
MAALHSIKARFPKLHRIRALTQSILNAINPTDLFVRMADMIDGIDCLRFGIRLEDCTGQSLETLPQDNEYENEVMMVMNDLTTTTMPTVGNGYLNLMKGNLNGGGGVVPWN